MCEASWRASARGSDRLLFLKALIRLAEAALRLQSSAGARARARWAALVFADPARLGAMLEALSPGDMHDVAQAIADGRPRQHADMAQPTLDRDVAPLEMPPPKRNLLQFGTGPG